MELHSVDFKTILAWLKGKNGRMKVSTLGGNSHLFCEHVNDSKMLIIGSTGQYKIIGVRFWNSVCRRMDSLNAEDRQMSAIQILQNGRIRIISLLPASPQSAKHIYRNPIDKIISQLLTTRISVISHVLG